MLVRGLGSPDRNLFFLIYREQKIFYSGIYYSDNSQYRIISRNAGVIEEMNFKYIWHVSEMQLHESEKRSMNAGVI